MLAPLQHCAAPRSVRASINLTRHSLSTQRGFHDHLTCTTCSCPAKRTRRSISTAAAAGRRDLEARLRHGQLTIAIALDGLPTVGLDRSSAMLHMRRSECQQPVHPPNSCRATCVISRWIVSLVSPFGNLCRAPCGFAEWVASGSVRATGLTRERLRQDLVEYYAELLREHLG